MEVNDPLKTSWTRKKKVSIQNVLCVERNFAWFPIISIFYISVVSTSIESHSCNFLRYRSRVRKVTYLLGTCSSIKLAYERGMLARKGKVRRRSFVARAEMRFRFYSLPSSVNLREIYPRTFDRFAFPAWHVR